MRYLLLLALAACTNKDADDSASADADSDGYVASDDCDDNNSAVYPGATEACDGADNDCNGEVDDAAGDLWYDDADGDGFGDPSSARQTCEGSPGWVADNTDCDDLEAEVHPDAVELCDGQDNNCDGDIDENALTTWYTDADTDGHGDPASPVSACTQPAGTAATALDCDDTNALVSPNGVELCDGIDNDCDARTDEEDALDATMWYVDLDADGFGDPRDSQEACDQPSGYVADATDCADTDLNIHPGATEFCNFVDDDCDAYTDEDDAVDTVPWYRDRDNDGFGDIDYTRQSCDQPSGYVADDSDCDDNASAVYPGAPELCNNIDDNCDAAVDESSATDATTWYADGDRDGYGDPSLTLSACTQPALYVINDEDCDDGDAAISPADAEVCDGADNNCDGAVDEDSAIDASTWYRDSDGDGFGDATLTTVACDEPSGYVDNDTDCDDSSAANSACSCTLTGVGSPTGLVSSGQTQGTWLVDPLETLGSGLIWEMNGYYGSNTLTRFPSQSAMISRSSATNISLAYSWDGTGAVLYDGYLYYNQTGTNTLVKADPSSGSAVAFLSLSSAGYRNTYHYQWGGYSDIDLAVDEQGLWVIYATSNNSGRLVVSKIDPASFTVTATYNTSSDTKTSIGNAFMVCGVLYATSDYYTSSATIDYAYDTATGSSWNPGIPFNNAYGYNSALSYNPTTGILHAWDSTYRVTYTTTVSY